MKHIIAKLAAKYTSSRRKKAVEDPEGCQTRIRKDLVEKAKHTAFGREHDFSSIRTYEDFKARVPVRDYEAFRPYIERIIAGEKDVVWPGRPLVFCKTSGTTSGIKYIPIMKDAMPYYLSAMSDGLLHYIEQTGTADFFNGSLLYLSSSPKIDTKVGGIPCGRLSGAVNNFIPFYIRRFGQTPSYAVNCIEDFDKKLDAVVVETATQDVRFISGNPPWIKQYFHKLLAYTGKRCVREVFPRLSLMVGGGSSFTPYIPLLLKLLDGPLDTIEIYPASEGFIAYQDRLGEPGMRLAVNTDIFYEFIPVDRFSDSSPPRLELGEVDTNTNYVLVLSNSSGLWSYVLGDTVRFVDTKPYRLLFTGRVNRYLSVFGEHVIEEEIEKTFMTALKEHPEVMVQDFTVVGKIASSEKDSCYEWWIEFLQMPQHLDDFARCLDETLQTLNPYYKDLRQGKTIKSAQVIPVEKGTFVSYLQSMNRYDPQTKIPHLSNDRKMVDKLASYRAYVNV